jgi:hypothetical protein
VYLLIERARLRERYRLPTFSLLLPTAFMFFHK